MMKQDPLKIWIRMDDTFKAKLLMNLAIYFRKLRLKRPCEWCINRLATKHVSVDK